MAVAEPNQESEADFRLTGEALAKQPFEDPGGSPLEVGSSRADPARYRQLAAECLLSAGQCADPKSRAVLIEIAYAWSRLAEQGVKNSRADLVYEHAPRRLQEP